MYIVKFTTKFKKRYKTLVKRGYDMSLIDKVIDVLREGRSLDGKYKDHILSGDYAGCHECHIKPDWLLVYSFFDDVLVLTLIDTGTHSDIFG
ncbi:MAG: type II toxin-antitoxin system YafQ family toxin [Clostridia bacterium]|nr:type II toxin-antitoxin system YafQ family toxin [Clostridia bacterium]